MNSWGNDVAGSNHNQFGVGGIPPMNQMMQNMMPPPLMPPMCMMPDMGTINPAPPAGPIIGPVMPDHLQASNNNVDIVEETLNTSENHDLNENQQLHHAKGQGRDNRENRSDRRDRHQDRNQERDRSRHATGSRDRYRNDRSRTDHNERGQDRNVRGQERTDRHRRDRPSKWGKEDDKIDLSGQSMPMAMSNMSMMPGMMQYNMMNNSMMGQSQHMDMGMGHIPNMMPGMNMMQNMMDPNMMMLNAVMPNQPIYFSIGVLLLPLPGTSLPNRRDKPPGCRTIFVGGLPDGINEEVVSEIFQRFGPISDVKMHRQGVCHVRFESPLQVENAFILSGYRFKLHDQMENEATTIFIDYSLNREDQNEFERNKGLRELTPPRIEPFTSAKLAEFSERFKKDEEFIELAPTLHGWLERGECNRKYANAFYSLIQAANSQARRLYNEKMALDDEFNTLKAEIKEKYAKIILQFEQVAKILLAAKRQRVSDHFSKQQRRNIEMWLKMTEEVENIKEEFNSYFDDEENEKLGKNVVSQDKYEELKQENDNLMYELEGYRNEAHLAKDEAERKFEKFKAQFIAQQALQNPRQVYPPLPPPPMPSLIETKMKGGCKPEPPPPTPDDMMLIKSGQVTPSEAKLISILTAFLLVHPLGATSDYMVSYVRTMMPYISQASVNQVLNKYNDIFCRKTTGIGPNIEHRWEYVTFDTIKKLL